MIDVASTPRLRGTARPRVGAPDITPVSRIALFRRTALVGRTALVSGIALVIGLALALGGASGARAHTAGAPPIGTSLEQFGSLLVADEDGDGDDQVTARICGAPKVHFVSHQDGGRTTTDQKSVFVTGEFEGADVTEIFHNGELVMRGESPEGARLQHVVSLELVEGENVIRLVGSETCSIAHTGKPGNSTAVETTIVYAPGHDGPSGDADGHDGLALTGAGLELLCGVLIGILLSFIGFLLVKRRNRREAEARA